MGFGTTANSTFVPDSDKLCNPSSPELKGCIFWRGGVFTPGRSDSWVKDRRTSDYNGSASNDGWDFLNAEKYKGLWWWQWCGFRNTISRWTMADPARHIIALGDDPLTNFTRGWDTVDLGEKTLPAYPFSVIESSDFPFGYVWITLLCDGLCLLT